jgi:hypothetical protein
LIGQLTRCVRQTRFRAETALINKWALSTTVRSLNVTVPDAYVLVPLGDVYEPIAGQPQRVSGPGPTSTNSWRAQELSGRSTNVRQLVLLPRLGAAVLNAHTGGRNAPILNARWLTALQTIGPRWQYSCQAAEQPRRTKYRKSWFRILAQHVPWATATGDERCRAYAAACDREPRVWTEPLGEDDWVYGRFTRFLRLPVPAWATEFWLGEALLFRALPLPSSGDGADVPPLSPLQDPDKGAFDIIDMSMQMLRKEYACVQLRHVHGPVNLARRHDCLQPEGTLQYVVLPLD